MMRAVDVIIVLDALGAAGIDAWLDGGWAVDALVGEETRPHDDLDMVVPIEAVPRALDALARLGFAVIEDELPTRVVVGDGADRKVDLHPVRFDPGGGGVQELQDGSTFRYPPAGFSGSGVVGGRSARCLTAEVQLLCHLGYEPDSSDIHDMRLLRERVGIVLPPPYGEG